MNILNSSYKNLPINTAIGCNICKSIMQEVQTAFTMNLKNSRENFWEYQPCFSDCDINRWTTALIKMKNFQEFDIICRPSLSSKQKSSSFHSVCNHQDNIYIEYFYTIDTLRVRIWTLDLRIVNHVLDHCAALAQVTNGTSHIRYRCRKTAVFGCHIFLISPGV
jgi:hypothetical protein